MSAVGPLPRRLVPLGGKARSAKGVHQTSRAPRQRQRGAALFAVLVLLFVMGWFALSAVRISTQQLQIVGNNQAEQHATAAAQRAIDRTISSNAFSKDPVAVARIPVTTDVDGDGYDDFTARLEPAPKCIRVRPIKTMELDIAKAADRVCLQSSGSNGNLVVAPGTPVASGDSMCAHSEWNIAAAVSDPTTNTSVTVQQGVAIRVVASDAKNYCK